jgi:hypothetical protein
MADVKLGARPPAAAVDYFRTKTVGGRFSFSWEDVWQEEHLASFVVAKMMSADLLLDTYSALEKALEEGWSRERFLKELRPTLQAKGWWGKQPQTDPKTGLEKTVQLGSPRRLGTIFDTNMRMANSAARWERLWEARETLPFLRYRHTPQERPRPMHLAWDGITLAITHVFWKTHWCPNGWRCKCWIQALGPGAAITSDEELAATGYGQTRAVLSNRTGAMYAVPVGIDPGFGYNVGAARLAGLTPPALPGPVKAEPISGQWPATLPALPSSLRLPKGIGLDPMLQNADEAFAAFAEVLGKAENDVFFDPAQVPIPVGRQLFDLDGPAGQAITSDTAKGPDLQYAQLVGLALKNPAEIWHSIQRRQDGTLIFVRNFVAAFKDAAGEESWFVVSFTENGGLWWEAAPYSAGAAGQVAAEHRVGTLVYQRKG